MTVVARAPSDAGGEDDAEPSSPPAPRSARARSVAGSDSTGGVAGSAAVQDLAPTMRGGLAELGARRWGHVGHQQPAAHLKQAIAAEGQAIPASSARIGLYCKASALRKPPSRSSALPWRSPPGDRRDGDRRELRRAMHVLAQQLDAARLGLPPRSAGVAQLDGEHLVVRGFASRPTLVVPGATSLSSSSRLPVSSASRPLSPVVRPPGRARLATRPLPTGSPIATMTMATLGAASRIAFTGGVLAASTTSGDPSASALAARASDSSLSSRSICRSMTRLLPSAKPWSRRPSRKASSA